MANATTSKRVNSRRVSFEAKLGASLERNPTNAPTSKAPPTLESEALATAPAPAERKITRVFMEFLPGDEEQVRRITKFLVNNERMGVNRMRVVRLALRVLAEEPETLRMFDTLLQEDGRIKANRQKRETPRPTSL